MEPGTLLAGRYRIDSVLASGGMGVVYSARQLPQQRWVAVKVLKPELLKHGPFLKRLQREAHTVATLKHPNIVEVTDLVLEEHLAFLVMELLRGESLASRIAAPEPMTEREVADIAAQVLCALEAAHEAGLVHRDVKPDNIFLVREADGPVTAKLLDFGLVKVEAEAGSRITATNAVLGTWQYMAPEQARGEVADTRADIYSLGAVLYYALTKKRPYQAADMDASMYALSPVQAPKLSELRRDLDPKLSAVIDRALEKDRHARWGSAREMLDALAPFIPKKAPVLPATAAMPSVLEERSTERFVAKMSQAIDAIVDGPTIERVERSRSEDTVDVATSPRPQLPKDTSTAIVLDPAGREAFAPTQEHALAESIESVELKSIAPSVKKWRPPVRVNVDPLTDSDETADPNRARLRKIGLFVALGLFVFASGLLLGEMLFR